MSKLLNLEGLPPRDTPGTPSKGEIFLLYAVLRGGAGIRPDQVEVPAGGGSEGTRVNLTDGGVVPTPASNSLPTLVLGGKQIAEYHGDIHYRKGLLYCPTFAVETVTKNASYVPLVARHASNLLQAQRDPGILDRPAVHLFEIPQELPEAAVIDLEWNPDGEITVVGFAPNGDEAYSAVPHGGALDMARAMVEHGKLVVGHNIISADLPRIGAPVSYAPERVFDTMLAAHLVHAHFAQLSLLDLGSLVRFYFPVSDWKHEQFDTFTYNGYDCAYNWRLYEALKKDLRATGQEHLLQPQQELEHLSGLMHSRGVAVDSDAIASFVEQRAAHRLSAKALLPVNPNSTQQVKAYAKSVGVRLANCQADYLERYKGKDPTLDLIIDFRVDSKNPSTWFDFELAKDKVHVTGVSPFIYPHFHTTGTNVDRFSSSGPNFQNLPPELRRFIVPRDPTLEIVAFDAAQAENRWVAWCAEDDLMMADFLSGKDVHSIVAGRISAALGTEITRQQGKTVVHASNYGEGHYNLARRMFGSASQDAQKMARDFQMAYFKAYPKTKAWHNRIRRQLDKGDLRLTNPYGRVRFVYDITSDGRLKKGAHFLGCSSSARNVNNKAVEIYKALGLVPILVVHDELVYELNKGDLRTRKMIADILRLPIPQMGGMLGAWEMKVGDNYGKKSDANPNGLVELDMDTNEAVKK